MSAGHEGARMAREWQPQDVTLLDLSFGRINGLLPSRDEIPVDMWREREPWSRLAGQWFFKGIDEATLAPKPGIDKGKALAHLACIMRSFEPKHEHKIGGVGYLLSLWFEPPVTP